VVKRNERFIPPYGTGASFYLRPVMFGTTAGLGVKPSKHALLVVFRHPRGAHPPPTPLPQPQPAGLRSAAEQSPCRAEIF